MLLRERAAAALLAITALAASGCINGQSRDIPPGPTAIPPEASVYVYVAQARDPSQGTDGGAVVAYQLGTDGLLPADPYASVSAVNPRRLVRHPELPVLYVATASQVLGFDISGGKLRSLCADGGSAPPCATAPVPGSNPVDMVFAQNDDGKYLMYVVERGGGNNLDTLTRVVAYELDDDGGLPSQPSSQVQTPNSLSYQGAAVVMLNLGEGNPPGYAYLADAGQSNIGRFPLLSDGNLPYPVPTVPISATPTPEPDASPTPSPTQTPVSTAWRAANPARMILGIVPTPIASPVAEPEPTGSPSGVEIYVVEQGRRRIGSIPVYDDGNLPKNPAAESNTRGIYNSIVVYPNPISTADPLSRIYGAAFQNGQVDSFVIEADGSIRPDTLSATFANTSSYPTGVSILPPIGDGPARLFVSVGGFNRVDQYEINADGTLPELPISSTSAINDTFPADVLVYWEVGAGQP